MAADKRASVHWEGAGKTGKGEISTETGALKAAPYGFASRFGDDTRGTNPEEIVGAAHAACLTMALAFALEAEGLTAKSIDTKAAVRLGQDGTGFKINRIQLELEASIPGIDDARFQQIAAAAKAGCPLSKALTGVPEVTLKATLLS
ncbi:MAG: peroxiredoxin, OsmC subfamily [Variovorax sp.]|jgi:osmotically inducible protein OsmC|nr:peroxiredoxin, OsmC subfamily [Variovorax sp.]